MPEKEIVKVFTRYDTVWRYLNVPSFPNIEATPITDGLDLTMREMMYGMHVDMYRMQEQTSGLEGVTFVRYVRQENA